MPPKYGVFFIFLFQYANSFHAQRTAYNKTKYIKNKDPNQLKKSSQAP